MNDIDILEKAIKKALISGYNNYCLDKEDAEIDASFIAGSYDYQQDYYQIIFCKNFAKAFWREHIICSNCLYRIPNNFKKIHCPNCSGCFCEKEADKVIAWEYHLQQMVLEDEPLKYLAQFLDNEE